MSEQSCKGIIFHIYPYSESSLIIHCLTDLFGLISIIAKGARRPKSSFAGRLDFLYLCEFELIHSQRSELHTLKEVILLDAHTRLSTQYALLCSAAENAILLERVIEKVIPVPEIFNLFNEYLLYLPQQTLSVLGDCIFKIRLLTLLGNLPQFDAMRLPESRMQLILDLLKKPWNELLPLVLKNDELLFLESILQRGLQNCIR